MDHKLFTRVARLCGISAVQWFHRSGPESPWPWNYFHIWQSWNYRFHDCFTTASLCLMILQDMMLNVLLWSLQYNFSLHLFSPWIFISTHIRDFHRGDVNQMVEVSGSIKTQYLVHNNYCGFWHTGNLPPYSTARCHNIEWWLTGFSTSDVEILWLCNV